MERTRFQFSLRRILAAMFWIAVCLGLAILNRSIPAAPLWDMRTALRLMTFCIPIASPFIALGTLFRETTAGLIVGLIAVVAVVIIAIALGPSRFVFPVHL